MAHPNNDNWVSVLVGQEVEMPLPSSIDEIAPARAGFDFSHLNQDLAPVAEVHENVVLRSRAGFDLTAEIYVPEGTGPFPVVLYSHGGGWCVGSAEGLRRPTRKIANQGYVVVNLDYGLAPEHPFPWALEDVIYAARWVKTHIAEYHGDPNTIVISGDSAGANLSAATIVALKMGTGDLDNGDLGGVDVSFNAAVLFFGVYDFPQTLLRPGSNAGATEMWWHLAYLGPHFATKSQHPFVSPALAPDDVLSTFPPTYLSVGCEDSLLPQSLEMTDKLGWLNVPVRLSANPGWDHAFSYADHLIPGVSEEFDRIFQWLNGVLA